MVFDRRKELLRLLQMESERNETAARRSRQEMLESYRHYLDMQQENLRTRLRKRVVPARVAREPQIMQDEDLVWALFDQDVPPKDERNRLPDLNIRYPAWPDVQAAAADRRHGKEPQLYLDGLPETPTKISENQVYDLFFAEWTDDRGFVGVACIIKDANSGEVVFRHGKHIGIEISHYVAEYKALIYGLESAKSIGVRRINAHSIRAFIYWEVQRHIEAPRAKEELDALQKHIQELDSFSVDCVSRADNEDAIELADVITKYSELDVTIKEHCLICLESIFPIDMVCQNGCEHRFCFNCLSQHVQNEISAGKVPVRCPQFTVCARYMDDNECQRLVSPKAFDSYSTRLMEASIPESEKVYCPIPGCSAMMCRTNGWTKTDIHAASSSSSTPRRLNDSSAAECVQCSRWFCVECLVPWHVNLTCQEYQALYLSERNAEDAKLLQLAQAQKWKKCGNCGSLIIRAEGCSHMTCRCGNQFCYICGANYRGKLKMCSCPLFSFTHPMDEIPQERMWQATNPLERILQERMRQARIARTRPAWRT